MHWVAIAVAMIKESWWGSRIVPVKSCLDSVGLTSSLYVPVCPHVWPQILGSNPSSSPDRSTLDVFDVLHQRMCLLNPTSLLRAPTRGTLVCLRLGGSFGSFCVCVCARACVFSRLVAVHLQTNSPGAPMLLPFRQDTQRGSPVPCT